MAFVFQRSSGCLGEGIQRSFELSLVVERVALERAMGKAVPEIPYLVDEHTRGPHRRLRTSDGDMRTTPSNVGLEGLELAEVLSFPPVQ
ncbi:hypothetical protein ACWEVM_16420 [Streptomyces bauhiniae]|uniref:hypothetical protein n=1 Tax=Streptomyces bauhiniae TaxID=2340725 RepID=UPI003674D6B9